MPASEVRNVSASAQTEALGAHAPREDAACCRQEAHVTQALQPGMRVTLAVGSEPRTQTGDDGADVLQAEVRNWFHPRHACGLL